jgi:hypothetical protein
METTEPLISPAFWQNTAIVASTLVLLALWFFWWKGRPLKRAGLSGDPAYVFRASRLSRGNLLFPTQVLITPSSVIHYTPQWIGKREQAIHLAHIASMTIDTNLMFSDVIIETSGGTSTVRCHGHSKTDAVRMKDLVERYQSQHYRKPGEAG